MLVRPLLGVLEVLFLGFMFLDFRCFHIVSIFYHPFSSSFLLRLSFLFKQGFIYYK